MMKVKCTRCRCFIREDEYHETVAGSMVGEFGCVMGWTHGSETARRYALKRRIRQLERHIAKLSLRNAEGK